MAIKLVVFDFDGTIIEEDTPNVWELANRTAGSEKARRMAQEYYASGTDFTDYADFCRRMLEQYRADGVSKEVFYRAAVEGAKPVKGAKYTLDAIREAGLRTAIISGGYANTYRFVSEKYGIKVDKPLFAIDVLFDEGGLVKGGRCHPYNYAGKVDALRELWWKLNITAGETAYVGDGEGDIAALREAGLSIAFGTDEKWAHEAADVVVKGRDLRKILPVLRIGK